MLSSIRLEKEPSFPLHDISHRYGPLSTFATPIWPDSGSYSLNISVHLKSFAAKQDAADIPNMLGRLHELSTFLNLARHDAILCYAGYPDRVYVIEHSILTLLARISSRSCSLSSIGIIRTLLIAGLMFIYTNLRQTPVGHGIRRRLTERVKSSLMTHTENQSLLVSQLPAEMLWMAIIAGTSTSQQTKTDGHDHEWYTALIKGICLANGLWTWNEVERFCACMPMLETSFSLSCREYWKVFVL